MEGFIAQIVLVLLALLIRFLQKGKQQADESEAVTARDAQEWEDVDEELHPRTSEPATGGGGRPAPATDGRPVPLEPTERPKPGDRWPEERRAEPVAAAYVDPYAAEREELIHRVDRLLADCEGLASTAQVDRATGRISAVLSEYVAPRARALRTRVASSKGAPGPREHADLGHLTQVFHASEALIRQRRVPHVRKALGDADAMARACYDPVMEFARANRLPLTSAEPVTLLAPFELGIWAALIPTGVAPIFLPPRFFEDVRWWPALAHEIGHDFLAATGDTQERLRRQLGVPSEQVGTRPLDLRHGNLQPSEVLRVFGGFFEEIFCDVFGTMMLGPAYGYTMVDLFAEPEAPERTATVHVDETGWRYGTHPPRYLRVRMVAHVLELMGEDQAAREIVSEWDELHGETESILFPVAGGLLGIPAELMVRVTNDLATRLYREGMDGLDGHAMADIPGLDYGPHQAAEARRARDAILAGKVPSQHRARAVVAGAVLAWRVARERHGEILTLARRAIVGITETREDSYSLAAQEAHEPRSQAELREAFLLHTMLAPPPAVRRLRPGRGGFLERRGWQ